MQRRQLILGLASLLIPTKLFAKDTENYWKDKPPAVREWLRTIKPPGENKLACCSEADGKPCLEEIRDGKYWATLPAECYTSEMAHGEADKTPHPKPVPDECIIRPNKAGEPVAWVNYIDGKINFRCYCPGGGV